MHALVFTDAQISSFTEIQFRPNHEIGEQHHKALLEDTRKLLGKPEERDASGNIVYDKDTVTVTNAIERDFRKAYETNDLAKLSNVLSFTKVSEDYWKKTSASASNDKAVNITQVNTESPISEEGAREGYPIYQNHKDFKPGNPYGYAASKSLTGEDK